jgi:hypothetical protein
MFSDILENIKNKGDGYINVTAGDYKKLIKAGI